MLNPPSLRLTGDYSLNYQKESLGLAVLLLSSGLGCTLEEVDSDAIRTKGMYAEVLAIAPGNGLTLVRANLTVGGQSGTRVHLTGEDQLVAETADASAVLARRGRGRYEENLEGESSREIVVRLERGPADDGAQGSVVLPEPFAMHIETNSGAGIDRSTPLITSWENPSLDVDTELDWSVEGDCIWPDSGTTPDDGVMTLQPEHVRVRSTQAGEDCLVRLTLDRSAQNATDPLFVPGSNIRGVQRRAVSFVSTPGVGEKNGPGAPVQAEAAEK